MFVRSNGYIYFSKYCSDGRAKASTGIKTDGPIDRDSLKKSEQLLLNRVDAAATKHVESCERSGDPLLKSELEEVVIKAIGREIKFKKGMFADFKQVVEDAKTGKLLKHKSEERYSEGTVDMFNQCLWYLEEFSKTTGNPLTYNIDVKWVKALVRWFTDNGKSKNTIASFGGGIRNLFGITYRLGKHKNQIFKHECFSFRPEQSDNIHLTEAEINALLGLNLNKAQTRARDIFVFGCYVGLRSKDMRRVNEYKVRGGNLIEVLTAKKGIKVVIPLHPLVKQIIEKYGDGNLPVIARSGMNLMLPKICLKAADICESFKEQRLVTITRGGVKTSEYYHKYDMVSSHTWRRCFCTNAYKAGIPIARIMLISGHKSESSFMRYIKIEAEENAQELLGHAFFKGREELPKLEIGAGS